MVIALILAVCQFAPAFLTLDLIFRRVPLDPVGLRAALARYRWIYVGFGAAFCVIGVWGQWLAEGLTGLVMAVALNWVPWWLLWRFGLRKQFTFLFKDDGGMAKPDP